MNRYLSFTLAISVTLSTLAIPLRAATKPHADKALEAKRTWTNDGLRRLRRIPALISIVGQANHGDVQDVDVPASLETAEDPAWYAAQAESLKTRLEAEQTSLRNFTQALEDARELKSTSACISLSEDDIGITPEATIDILQKRMRETQSELDALEDLARHNGIEPGILRGQVR